MTDTIDFDAIRPERKLKNVKVNGKTYSARHPSMGSLVEAVEAAQSAEDEPLSAIAAVRSFMVEIFGEDAEAEILYSLDQDDYAKFLSMLIEAFASEGKVPAPSQASQPAGARSKRTSNASTRSTSAKRVSEKNGSVSAVSRA